MKSSLRESAQTPSFFARQKPLHLVLGGGKLADILLWREKKLSAAIVAGFSIIWVHFEVAEYNFVSLLCHILMAIMFILFVWYNAAGLITWRVPEIYDLEIPESTKLDLFLRIFYDISTGKDMKLFVVTIAGLFIMSAIGSYFTTLNLLYFMFLCMVTVPVMYERYENEVEYLASKGNHDLKRLYNKFDSNVLNKIPMGPVKATINKMQIGRFNGVWKWIKDALSGQHPDHEEREANVATTDQQASPSNNASLKDMMNQLQDFMMEQISYLRTEMDEKNRRFKHLEERIEYGITLMKSIIGNTETDSSNPPSPSEF